MKFDLLITRRWLLASAGALVLAPQVAAAESGTPITMYKDPFCGCCTIWAQYMTAKGFNVTIEEPEDLAKIKSQLGVPDAVTSCHTALVEGYFIEGHIPADDVRKLLADRPKAKGLALPGMPVGSPGMEVTGRAADPYEVLLVNEDGTTRVFARH